MSVAPSQRAKAITDRSTGFTVHGSGPKAIDDRFGPRLYGRAPMQRSRRQLLVGLGAAATGCGLPAARKPTKLGAPLRVEGLRLEAVGGSPDDPGGFPLPVEVEATIQTNRRVERGDHVVVVLLRDGEVIDEQGGLGLRDIQGFSGVYSAKVSLNVPDVGDYQVVASDVRGHPLEKTVSVRRCPALWGEKHTMVSTSGSVVVADLGRVVALHNLWLPCDEPRAYRAAWLQDGELVEESFAIVPSKSSPARLAAKKRALQMQRPEDLQKKASEAALWRRFLLAAGLPRKHSRPGQWEARIDVDGFGGWRFDVMLDADRRPEGARREDGKYAAPGRPERVETPSDLAIHLAERSDAERKGRHRERIDHVEVTSAELRGLTRSVELNERRAALNTAMLGAEEKIRGMGREYRERVYDPVTGGTKVRAVSQGASTQQRRAAYLGAMQPHRGPLQKLIEAHGHPWTAEESLV